MDGGTATVHAAWTGTGELVRVSETFRATSKTVTQVFRFRDATATGRVNGTDFGTSQFADIFNTSSAPVEPATRGEVPSQLGCKVRGILRAGQYEIATAG